jgi:ABC-type transport system involved in cytochrome bd biosynthesis fused ATPase/permease subunit
MAASNADRVITKAVVACTATADAVTTVLLQPRADRCCVLITHRPDDAALGDVVLRLAGGRLVGATG